MNLRRYKITPLLVMQADSVKPFNSEGTPVDGSRATSLSNITIESNLSNTLAKNMGELSLGQKIDPIQSPNMILPEQKPLETQQG